MEERRSFEGRRSGFRGGKEFASKPIEVGKEYDVDIKEMSRRGEGVARIQGLVIFVPHTKAGDHVNVRIKRVSNRFAEAEVVMPQEETAEENTEKSESSEG
jgi:predicted RNA-binding protein with TRAM domain